MSEISPPRARKGRRDSPIRIEIRIIAVSERGRNVFEKERSISSHFSSSFPLPDETIVPPDVPSYLSSQGTLSERQDVCIRVEASGGPQPNGHVDPTGNAQLNLKCLASQTVSLRFRVQIWCVAAAWERLLSIRNNYSRRADRTPTALLTYSCFPASKSSRLLSLSPPISAFFASRFR